MVNPHTGPHRFLQCMAGSLVEIYVKLEAKF